MISTSPLTSQAFAALTRSGVIIERDHHGPKVLRLPDGLYLKIFRRKHLFNRDLLQSAAVRFARHACQLQRLGIRTVKVVGLHRIEGEAKTAVLYEPIPGRALRELLAGGEADAALIYRIGGFIAELHRRGVLFRSLHPGNIIVDGDRLGLIDMLDMRIRPWPLTRWARRRNWLHILRTPQDRPHWTPVLIDSLLAGYRQSAGLGRREFVQITQRVHAILTIETEVK